MVHKKTSCLRCNNFMEEGYVADFSDSGVRQSRWMPGGPQKSFWSGLKIDKKALLPVSAMRCTRCGRLEFFANQDHD